MKIKKSEYNLMKKHGESEVLQIIVFLKKVNTISLLAMTPSPSNKRGSLSPKKLQVSCNGGR